MLWFVVLSISLHFFIYKMNEVEKYHTRNVLQTRGVQVLLQKFAPKITWKGKKKIVDIGCGPGNITHNQLFPLIFNDAELIGIDVYEPMIQFANSHYQKDFRLNFETFDILDPKFVEKYAISFDAAFSFYCFNWIQDHKNLTKNVYSILKPGGEMLSIQTLDCMHYELYEILATSPKWFPYMENYKRLIPPNRESDDPVCEVKSLMKVSGFLIEKCYLSWSAYTFPSLQAFYDWMEALNPISKNIPKHLAQEYEREWKRIIFNKNPYILHNVITNEVTYRYSTVTVFAKKPL